MNLFDQALENNELPEFIFGKDKYFVLDREYGAHWPLGSYNLYIQDYLLRHNVVFEEEIWFKIVNSIDDKRVDVNLFIDFLFGLLIPYYYPANSDIVKQRMNHTPDFLLKN